MLIFISDFYKVQMTYLMSLYLRIPWTFLSMLLCHLASLNFLVPSLGCPALQPNSYLRSRPAFLSIPGSDKIIILDCRSKAGSRKPWRKTPTWGHQRLLSFFSVALQHSCVRVRNGLTLPLLYLPLEPKNKMKVLQRSYIPL